MYTTSALYTADGYKIGHKAMLAPGTTRLGGTWIPRTLKYMDPRIKKVVSIGQALTWRRIIDLFNETFFSKSREDAEWFGKDMSAYLGIPYDASHFLELYDEGKLPITVYSLPEGIETPANVPHQYFISEGKSYAWLTLYLETVISQLSWKMPTSATNALQFRRVATEWIKKTNSAALEGFLPFSCHDFSARGLDEFSAYASGIGHAASFLGSDTIAVIPASRYYYKVKKDEMPIYSVNASEHSVSTTKIFTVGERQMLIDWLKLFPVGILSIVADTFDLWKLLVEYMGDPEVKALVMARDGKVVIRPDSGDPVDIICGLSRRPGTWSKEVDGKFYHSSSAGFIDGSKDYEVSEGEYRGVVELLWNMYGGTVSEEGYKCLDSHVGVIYGDSINLNRQTAIYERLARKGFSATNIVLGIGSFTYQLNSRDSLGFAAKGSWFEVEQDGKLVGIDIYKDPITDDGTKKSLKGLIKVINAREDVTSNELLFDGKDNIVALEQSTLDEMDTNSLWVKIVDNGVLQEDKLPSLAEIRERISKIA